MDSGTTAVNFETLRRSPQPKELTAEAAQWFASLPQPEQPTELSAAYPRIVITLSSLWTHRRKCSAYFDELLIDRRGGRQGFPGGVALEIAALKDFYETHVHAMPQSTWDRLRARNAGQ